MKADGGGKRPFGEEPKPVFDLVTGVALPIVCLAMDPLLFRESSWLRIEPMFGRMRAPAYAFVAIEIVVLAVCALRLVVLRGPVATAASVALAVGGLVAMLAGLFLAPLVLVGLAIGIGLLGLVPWFTAHAFFRNSFRVARRGHWGVGPVPVLAVVAGLFVCVAPPVAVARAGDRAMAEALRTLEAGGDGSVERGADILDRWRAIVFLDDLVVARRRAGDAAVRRRIAAAYEKVTGRRIEARIDEIARTRD
jgi:hypothetical protein